VVAALFGVSRFFAPLVAAIPAAAYAPALIIGGAMMIAPILKIDFDDYTELIPAFRVIALMSFTYNSEWESLPVSSCIHCSSWRRAMARNTRRTLDALCTIDTFLRLLPISIATIHRTTSQPNSQTHKN